jgi:hypothetical protein
MPLKKPIVKPTKKVKTTKVSTNKKNLEKAEDVVEEKIITPQVEITDSQKEFFRLMAEKIKEDMPEDESMASDFSDDSADNSDKIVYIGKVALYRKMFWRFSFLVAILLVAVFYFSIIRLEVVIESDQKSLEDSLNFYAYSDNTQVNIDRAVKANINRVELNLTEVFPSTGQKNLGGQVAGKVTIINNYNRNQPLVATTRLLTPNNKLFRIKNTVNVPAGGSLEVEVYADDISSDMAIAPTKFTIPGLWEGIQDQIYAESYEPFVYDQEVIKFVAQSDIDKAIDLLNQSLIEEAKNRAKSSGSQKNIFDLDPSSVQVEISEEIGEEVDSFSVTIKGIVNIISLEEKDVIEVIKQRLAILDFNQERSEVDTKSLNYELLNFNPSKSLAEIKVDFSAHTSSINDSQAFNKEHLVNLNENQIKAYLNNIPEIDSYDLIFKPKFFKRAPMFSSRITVSYK